MKKLFLSTSLCLLVILLAAIYVVRPLAFAQTDTYSVIKSPESGSVSLSADAVKNNANASGQSASGQNIVVVNIRKIMEEANAAKDMRDKLSKTQEKHLQQKKSNEASLKKQHEALLQEKSLISKELFEKKKKDFEKKYADLQKEWQKKQTNFDNDINTSFKIIEDAIFQIVNDMAARKKFDIAISSERVVYAKANLDITDEILVELNKKLPSINFSSDSKQKTGKK